MILFTLLAGCFTMTGLIYRKGGLLTPSAFLALFSTFGLSVFYASYVTGIDYPSMEAGGFFVHNYDHVVNDVFFVYFLIVLAALLGLAGVRRKEALRLGVVTDQAQAVIGRVLKSPAIHYAVQVLFLVSAWHLLAVDKQNLWENNEYLTINMGSRMNISNPILLLVHMVMGPICLCAMLLAYLFFKHRRTVNGILCLLIFLYFFLIEMAAFSRYPAFAFALMAALLAVERKARGRRAVGPPTVAALLAALWMFFYAVSARGGSVHGISAILPNLFLANLEFSHVEFVYVNPSLGPYVLAEAILGGPYDYPLSYKLASFSPFPSFIDGYAGLLDYQHRVNWFTPFNVPSELYYFGLIYQILFYAIFIVCLRTLNMSVISISGSTAFIMSAPSIYVLIYMQQYPIRNSFRLLIGATVLTILVIRRMGRPAPASPRRSTAPAPSGPRPPPVPPVMQN